MWRDNLILKEGETLEHQRSWESGFMQEQDNDLWHVIGPAGKVGEVKVEDHTSVKGFRRTVRVVQRDAEGKVIVDTSYNPQ